MCNNYTLECQEEKLGCKGCAYNKPLAKTDRTYCINAVCTHKCSRNIENYKFDSYKDYSFIAECEG